MLETCDPGIIQEILTSKNTARFRPLHQALISANTENLTVYLKMLKNCDPRIIQEILTSKNIEGFTPLHYALILAILKI